MSLLPALFIPCAVILAVVKQGSRDIVEIVQRGSHESRQLKFIIRMFRE